MDSSEAPFRFENCGTHFVLVLYPPIVDGQWGNVSEVGTEILGRLEAFPNPVLIVDLSPLEYMGSAQVALLVRIWKAVRPRHGKMVIQSPAGTVREVLQIAGLRALWQIVDTRSEALAEFNLAQNEASRPSLYGPWIALLSLFGAGVSLGLVLAGAGPRQGVLIAELALAGGALITGGLTALFHRQKWRWIGAGVSVASLAVLAIAAAQLGAVLPGTRAAGQVQLRNERVESHRVDEPAEKLAERP